MSSCVICEGMCCDDADAWRSTAEVFKAQTEHYRAQVADLERRLAYARRAVENAKSDLISIDWS